VTNSANEGRVAAIAAGDRAAGAMIGAAAINAPDTKIAVHNRFVFIVVSLMFRPVIPVHPLM
jgi:hypothetical protein